MPLLGVVNRLNVRKIVNFDYLFSGEKTKKETEFFKESLRKIRHDIESSGAKSFLFVSLKPQEGKSFLVASLAYTFTLKNKKVLIIDTNFKNNTLTGLTSTPFDDNPVTGNGVQLSPSATSLSVNINLPNVAIVGNKGGNNSPSELLAGVDFKKKIDDLASKYDYILLEAAALNNYNDARELVDYVEKVIPVFDATTAIKQEDENGLSFLRSLNNKLLGSVLNNADLKSMN
ncbi:MAG: CpsD/CapB family tyrosine-protein kinase [Saprospiraceae bacterium]|nr:CpsD/CapB family tyrosine-protein kinase [Saprospiraceae bacterium]